MDQNLETVLLPDPTTGFLASSRCDRIAPELKTKLLELYRQSGNLHESARQAGIQPRVMRWHLVHDPEFKRQYQEVLDCITDEAEGAVRTFMLRPSNVIDRMAWLRARRPGVWNPQQNQTVEVNVKVTDRLVSKAQGYIDTTATPTNELPKKST